MLCTEVVTRESERECRAGCQSVRAGGGECRGVVQDETQRKWHCGGGGSVSVQGGRLHSARWHCRPSCLPRRHHQRHETRRTSYNFTAARSPTATKPLNRQVFASVAAHASSRFSASTLLRVYDCTPNEYSTHFRPFQRKPHVGFFAIF